MYQTVELVLKSYMPKQLEIGMWFINKINPNTRKEYSEIWALDKLPHDTLEEFIVKNGAPVEPYLIYDEQVIAEPHEIGWWDEGEHSKELRDIELSDINFILHEYNGFVNVEIDEWDFDHEKVINPILYAHKIKMCSPEMYHEDEENDGPWLCSVCNGSGYAYTPDLACFACLGEGQIYSFLKEDDTDMDDNS